MLTWFPYATFSEFPVRVAIPENAGFVLLLNVCDLTSFSDSQFFPHFVNFGHSISCSQNSLFQNSMRKPLGYSRFNFIQLLNKNHLCSKLRI